MCFFLLNLCCANSGVAANNILQFVQVKASAFLYLNLHFLIARISTMIKANFSWSSLALFFRKLASCCQIARNISVAMVIVDNLGQDTLVVPNSVPTSPFPIRAGGVEAKAGGIQRISSLITIMYITRVITRHITGPSGVIPQCEIVVGITTFCKDKKWKGLYRKVIGIVQVFYRSISKSFSLYRELLKLLWVIC